MIFTTVARGGYNGFITFERDRFLFTSSTILLTYYTNMIVPIIMLHNRIIDEPRGIHERKSNVYNNIIITRSMPRNRKTAK